VPRQGEPGGAARRFVRQLAEPQLSRGSEQARRAKLSPVRGGRLFDGLRRGGIGLIPPELDQALAADPDLKTVVMDGGGNDILIPDPFQFPNGGSCKNDANAPNIPDCQKIVQKALDAATTLMKRAAAAGVEDVVYFFYPHVPEGTLLGGLHPNAILDYALPKVKALCEQAYSLTSGQLTCHFVDMIQSVYCLPYVP
jgi:hypothetical protein